MRRLLVFVLGLFVLLLIGAFALLVYIRPDGERDLAYREFRAADKVADMVKRRQLNVVLTQEEVNGLLKKKLAESPGVTPEIRVTGADFTLQDGILTGDLNLLYLDKIPFGAKVVYTLKWQSPQLIAEFEKAQVKDFSLPRKWLELPPYAIRLNDLLPAFVSVKDVRMEHDSIRVEMKGTIPF